MPKVRLALAQTNPIVGDLTGNLVVCFERVAEAAKNGASLVQFGEMAVTGYPIEDLAYRPSFIDQAMSALTKFASELQTQGLGDIRVVIGSIDHAPAHLATDWAIAQNCAFLIFDGKIQGRYAKHHLPNYSVFDEYRIFVPGNELLSFEVSGLNFSTVICEDIWQSGGPVANLKTAQTDVTLVLNGSPFEIDKDDRRLNLVTELSQSHETAVSYVNLVGGQDDLVFDGDSIFVDAQSNLILRARKFEESINYIDIDSKSDVSTWNSTSAPKPDEDSELADIWNALVVGLRDYVHKNGFKSVVLGLSGGIDSAVCAAIAADALGASKVFGVSLPSKYSSDHSKSDAFDLAERLGLSIRTEAIAEIVQVAEEQLKLESVAAENLQARVRGLILMALSNAEGHLTLTTGNKTELAVGYSTIYGDSVGGFAPIKDVAKTLVWELARYRNRLAQSNGEVEPIPENSISKPPSAELRPGQVDQDSLPEYEVLDEILECFLTLHYSSEQLVAAGFDAAVVAKVVGLVERSEWKRRQGAIGPKITGLAFGRDRRMPITNRFKP